MANFRDGFAVQGGPVSPPSKSVYLTADDTIVDVEGVSVLLLSSDDTTAANRTFTVPITSMVGRELLIVFTSGSSTTCQLADSGVMRLVGNWEPTQYDVLKIVSDGTNWLEQYRGPDPTSAGVIVNADVSASAAIAFSKLAALPSAQILVGNGSNVAAAVAVSGDISLSNAGVAAIASDVIVNADVKSDAAIAFSKLAALTSAQILVGDGSNVATAVAVSGDISLSNAGVAAIASDVIVNADVKSDAAIAYSKLAALTDGNILVGNGSNVATSVAMSGDVTIANTGATTIGAAKVGVSKLDPAVMLEATGTLTNANLLAIGTPIELIAAPSAGKVHIVDEIELFHDFDTAAYTGGADLQIEYATSGDNIALVADSFVTGAADQNAIIKPSTYNLDGSTGTGVGFDVTANAAKAVQVVGTNFADGSANNIVKYRIRYHTVTLLT